MNEVVLELTELRKKIKKKEIIKGINLKVKKGEIFGFLGPNGAGKTTTIRMISGLIRPTSGDIKICGKSVLKEFVPAMSNAGFIIENPDMYNFMSGLENLKYFASIGRKIDTKRINEVVEIVGLKNRIKDKVSTYSLGMKQRLGLGQAILSRPKLLILDEPVNGLDPSGINEFRNLIIGLAKNEGMTIFLSSHLLSEVQLMCDRFAIVKQGNIIQEGKVKELVDTRYTTWKVDNPERARDILQEKFSCEVNINNRNELISQITEDKLVDANKSLIEKGVGVLYVNASQKTLEDVFLKLTEGDEIV